MNTVFVLTFLLIILHSAFSHPWCPGSTVPALCCSQLVDGNVSYHNARFIFRLWYVRLSNIWNMNLYRGTVGGFEDTLLGDNMTLTDCYESCRDNPLTRKIECMMIFLWLYEANLVSQAHKPQLWVTKQAERVVAADGSSVVYCLLKRATNAWCICGKLQQTDNKFWH